MNVNTRKLKIKLKHLATEPAIIRREEEKELSQAYYYRHVAPEESAENLHHYNYYQLHQHRVMDVRKEARATHLAYAICRGKSYETTETDTTFESRIVPYERVIELVAKYKYGYRIKYISDKLREAVRTEVREWFGFDPSGRKLKAKENARELEAA